MTVEPWVWWALALALCYALLRVAEWYMDLPPTEADEYCSRVDREIDAFDEQQWSQRWEEYMDEREQQLMDRQFVADIEAYLRARERYEGAT